MTKDRAKTAYSVRVEAAEVARDRDHPSHEANGDEARYAAAHYPVSFTKGLDHDASLGVVNDPAHFRSFRSAIDNGVVEPFTSHVPVPTAQPRRKWEAPTAGVVYDLQGPDAQAVTMAPAPALCSDELAFEMAEVYELALVRDVPLSDLAAGAGSPSVGTAATRLNALPYAVSGFPNRPRTTAGGQLDDQTIFRGSSPGVDCGPYLSQFLLIGGRDQTSALDLVDGKIPYGAQLIDQKVPAATTGDDYMQTWANWLQVQQGYDVSNCGPGQNLPGPRRFISTPRDLATYVHFDALYQAYLNATLILLGMKTPFDPAFEKLSGQGRFANPTSAPAPGVSGSLNAGGFALWGGPHILTLVTEVATRALKAVRYQKFNNHLRCRPEVLAARIHRSRELERAFPHVCCECGCHPFTKLRNDINPTVTAVENFNPRDNRRRSALLPMAFAEGSPMHPSYGAGHATVAGACTTIVKAFFDTGTLFGKNSHGAGDCNNGKDGFYRKINNPAVYQPTQNGSKLVRSTSNCALTLEGELNKLAANISIGRNMAGVHFYSDYYDSLRMGEEIALGLLEEQALCYPTDDFVLTVPLFDGGSVRIGAK